MNAHSATHLRPLTVVLHRPIYSRNVGMCARAMANMGVHRLVLVAPQNLLTDEAKQGAAHAQDEIRNAVVYKDLDGFLASEGEGFRIALSGKGHRLGPTLPFEDVVSKFAQQKDHPFFATRHPVYLMFGAEDDGLSPEEMELCHHVCFLPTFGEITSLNLSHAVLLATYIVRSSQLLETRSGGQVSPEPIYHPRESIHGWLETLGFDLSAPKINVEKTLNRILLAQVPTKDELRILDSVIQQTIRRLKSSGPS
jgi:tRNA/rRNA methyltransferase